MESYSNEPSGSFAQNDFLCKLNLKIYEQLMQRSLKSSTKKKK